MAEEQNEDHEKVSRKQLKNAIQNLLTEIKALEERIERLENSTGVEVRTFENDEGDQFIALEPNQGEVYNANYFRKIVERLDEEAEESGEEEAAEKADELMGEPADGEE